MDGLPCSLAVVIVALGLACRHVAGGEAATGPSKMLLLAESIVSPHGEFFPRPAPYDRTLTCGTCSGVGANHCQGPDCTGRCAADGKQCYNSGNTKFGCCCDPSQVPKAEDAKCIRFATNGTCVISCCSARAFASRKVQPVMCDTGCCRPSDHGSPGKCGRSLYPMRSTGKRRHEACCVSQEASPDEQRSKGCCIVGSGVDCTSPEKTVPCCLWSFSADTWDPDPHVPCQQNNCSAYKPCEHGLGFDCDGRPGVPGSRGKRLCCLSKGSPSVNDPCQLSAVDCQDGGRFLPCPHGRGIDCASDKRAVCCLLSERETGSCRRTNCDSYEKEQRSKTLRRAVTLMVVLAAFMCAAYCWRDRIKRRLIWCFSACCRSTRVTSQVLLPSSNIVSASEFKEHSVRLALVIWCSHYVHGYGELKTARGDAEALATKLEGLDYNVELVSDATCIAMAEGFRNVMQKAAGKENALILIYYGGHAVEIKSTLLWAGIDSIPDQLNSHFHVVDMCNQLGLVHLKDKARKSFGCENEIKSAYFVVLANCCRVLPEGGLSQFVGNFESSRPWRRRHWCPGFYFIYAAAPGETALDSVQGSRYSPFLEEILKQIDRPQSLNCFYAAVSQGVTASTQGRQGTWLRETCSKDFHGVSLAPNPFRMRALSTSTCSSRGCSSASLPSSQRGSIVSSSTRWSVSSGEDGELPAAAAPPVANRQEGQEH